MEERRDVSKNPSTPYQEEKPDIKEEEEELFVDGAGKGLDLLDLSEPVSQTQTKAKKLEASSKTSSLKKKTDASDLISADAEQRGQALRGSDTASLDLADVNNFICGVQVSARDCAEVSVAGLGLSSDTEFWDKMQAEWEEMARRNWISENQEAQNQVTISASEKGYYFHTENPFKDWPGAFEEGLKRLKEGDLPVTILFMEAAILQDPGDAEAWQFLGITQAENENEQAAIVALQRCLELQPNNLKALMALAVSYTNTGHQQDACEALKNWIKQNPKYKYLVKSKKGSPGLTRRMSKSPVDSSVLEGVKELYLEAAHQNGDMIDPDLQTGLGVLFHLSGEFNRAIDAFNAALTVRPEDYSLWNRLGATLANGDRSEEAVEAYTRALEIQPGFIRSRYNLGISCINLGAYSVWGVCHTIVLNTALLMSSKTEFPKYRQRPSCGSIKQKHGFIKLLKSLNATSVDSAYTCVKEATSKLRAGNPQKGFN
ncbi:hypothetical protein CB1_000693004 [Camelus ferus]|nr:hypothetical protein CB1_000693004 [Camelus ferus]